MPSLNNETVLLLVNGQFHSTWTNYTIDADLMTAADAWSMTLGQPNLPIEIVGKVAKGMDARVLIGGDTVLVGVIDTVRRRTGKAQRSLTITGRDRAGMLRDCSAPVFTAKQATLQDVINTVVKPFGITNIQVSTSTSLSHFDKITIDPGTSAWNALVYAAEGEGLWPWFDPDGTLIVGGPDYNTPPVATLIMRDDGQGNNVEAFDISDSIAERYSQVTVLGQAHGRHSEQGKNAMKVTVTDTTLTAYRPFVYVDHDAPTLAAVEARARKILSDSRLNGMTLTADVKGHRIDDATLWKPGQRVHVIWEEQGIDDIYFLMGRRFDGGRGNGQRTRLTLKEDGIWILDAHPHDGKRRHKQQSGPLSIVTTYANGDTSVTTK